MTEYPEQHTLLRVDRVDIQFHLDEDRVDLFHFIYFCARALYAITYNMRGDPQSFESIGLTGTWIGASTPRSSTSMYSG